MKKYDYIIVGAGVAGLYASLNIPEDKSVLILSKYPPWECNTFYAQGGVAVAKDEADVAVHIQDTIEAGAHVNNKEAVEILSTSSLDITQDFIKRGFNFDRDAQGNILFTKEAAHSTKRIFHVGDGTGRYVHIFLMNQNKHELRSNAVVVDLLIKKDVCYGVTISENREFKNIYADTIILASGGIGSLYEYHTNPKTISADIQGLALMHNIKLKDMQFTQFHPTVFIWSRWARKILLTEALRGEGAKIVDEEGREFLKEYHPLAELAPRDIVSRAIFDHRKKGHETFLDFSMFEKEYFKKRFPTVYRYLKDFDYNLPYERVPISPAFHFSMGGIEVDLDSRVKGFQNLYAVGEVACTGVHGANRLASNSLLEGLVFSKRAVQKSLELGFKTPTEEFDVKTFELVKKGDKEIKNRLRQIMWNNVGIIRHSNKLLEALEFVEAELDKDIGRFIRLRLLSAQKIIQGAIAQKESLGAHYLED